MRYPKLMTSSSIHPGERLAQLLAQAYPAEDDARGLLKQVGGDPPLHLTVPWGKPAVVRWRSIIDAALRASLLSTLVNTVLSDGTVRSFHEDISTALRHVETDASPTPLTPARKQSGSPHASANRGGLFAAVGRICVEAVRKIGNPNYLFVIVLFIPTLVAISAVTLARSGSPTALVVVALIAGMLIFLVVRLVQVGRPAKATREHLVEVDQLGTLRTSIYARSEAELESLRAKLGVPAFPKDHDTLTKKADYLLDRFPVSALRPASARLERGSLVAGLLLLGVAGAILLWDWQRSAPHPAETTIRAFYEGLNHGITGEADGWETAWGRVSDEFRANLVARFPGDYPAKFGTLYEGSRYHRLLATELAEERNDRLRIYTVVYSLEEGHPGSKLYDRLSPQNSPTVVEFYTQFPTPAAVSSEVWAGVTRHYETQSKNDEFAGLSPAEIQTRVREHVEKRVTLHDLANPRLLSIVSGQFGLSKRQRPLTHPQQGQYHFYTMEVVYVRVHRQKDGWRIGKFVPQARYFVPMHVH